MPPELYNDTGFSHKALTTLSSSANKDPAHRESYSLGASDALGESLPAALPSHIRHYHHYSSPITTIIAIAHISQELHRDPPCPLIKYCLHI